MDFSPLWEIHPKKEMIFIESSMWDVFSSCLCFQVMDKEHTLVLDMEMETHMEVHLLKYTLEVGFKLNQFCYSVIQALNAKKPVSRLLLKFCHII